MTTFRILIGILVYLIGLIIGFNLWFKDTVSNASGVPALLTVWIISGIALAIILWPLQNSKKLALIPIVGAFLTHMLMNIFMNWYKKQQIENHGHEATAIVTFRGRVRTAKSTSEEIRYTYYVDKRPYFKYYQSEKFILKNSISTGDTLQLKYLPNRPHWHEIISVIKNKR